MEAYLHLAVLAAVFLPVAITYLLYREADHSALFAGFGVACCLFAYEAFGIEQTYLRLAVLFAVILPPAVTDLRGRYADDSVMFGGLGAACCFLIYDVLSGGFLAHTLLVQAGVIFGILLGCIMLVMAVRGRMMGVPDAIIILTATMLVPALAGLPAGIIIVMAANLVAVGYFIADYLWRNIDDIAHGRPCARNFGMHIKRRGERFTSGARHGRLGGMDGDTVLDDEGGEFFEKEDAHGMEVMTQIPMLTMYLLGICAASLLVLAPEDTPGRLLVFLNNFSGNGT